MIWRGERWLKVQTDQGRKERSRQTERRKMMMIGFHRHGLLSCGKERERSPSNTKKMCFQKRGTGHSQTDGHTQLVVSSLSSPDIRKRIFSSVCESDPPLSSQRFSFLPLFFRTFEARKGRIIISLSLDAGKVREWSVCSKTLFYFSQRARRTGNTAFSPCDGRVGSKERRRRVS